MSADVLAAAVPDLRSVEQLPTVRGVPRYAVLTPDGRTVLVSIDSPDAVSRFRHLVAVSAIGSGVLDLLAAGVRSEQGFVVQPMPVELPAEGARSPAEVESLLRPVSEALAALHAAGMCLGALALGSLSLAADGSAVLADLLPAVPIGTR
ncbi:MAG: hypothetical protein M3Y42_11795, partial [Actinomycetota bacterium]|nr:hypothetical protein [Actinomycetota bacterium]